MEYFKAIIQSLITVIIFIAVTYLIAKGYVSVIEFLGRIFG